HVLTIDAAVTVIGRVVARLVIVAAGRRIHLITRLRRAAEAIVERLYVVAVARAIDRMDDRARLRVSHPAEAKGKILSPRRGPRAARPDARAFRPAARGVTDIAAHW